MQREKENLCKIKQEELIIKDENEDEMMSNNSFDCNKIKQEEFIIKDENEDEMVPNNSFENLDIKQEVNKEISPKNDAVNDFKKEEPLHEEFLHISREENESSVKKRSLSCSEKKFKCSTCEKSFSHKEAVMLQMMEIKEKNDADRKKSKTR